MCPMRNKCRFYTSKFNEKLSIRELEIMKYAFCDSDLFFINEECKIFSDIKDSKIQNKELLPIG